jgi:multidrug transporter EmrE-like cation transporter
VVKNGWKCRLHLSKRFSEGRISNMTRLTALLIGVSVCLSAVGQMLLKAGVGAPRVREAAAAGSIPDFLIAVAGSWLVWVGLVVFGVSVLLWLNVLTRVEVSTAYPFVALGLILTAAMGYLFFGEAMSAGKIVGIALIAAGVVLVARNTTAA